MTTETGAAGEPLEILLALLDLERLELNLFRGLNRDIGSGRLFGGQVLAQALVAAGKTVEGRAAHSLHGYFLLAGMSDLPVIYDVELTRDGGSFSTRRVVARQRGKTIFHMELSFHREERGFEHAAVLDVDAPEPEQLLTTRELVQKYAAFLPQGAAAAMAGHQTIVELKPVNPEELVMIVNELLKTEGRE